MPNEASKKENKEETKPIVTVPPPPIDINLMWPTLGSLGYTFLDKRYPNRFDEKGNYTGQEHEATDIVGNYLTPIVSIAEGTVERVGAYGGFNVSKSPNSSLLISHKQKVTTKGCECSEGLLISHYVHGRLYIPDAGDPVSKGEIIGFVGGLPANYANNSSIDSLAGNTNAPHLHFSLGITNIKINDTDEVDDNVAHKSIIDGRKRSQSSGGPYINPGYFNASTNSNESCTINKYLNLEKNFVSWTAFKPAKINTKKFLSKLTRLSQFGKDSSKVFVTNTEKFKEMPMNKDDYELITNKSSTRLNGKSNNVVNYDPSIISPELMKYLEPNPYFNGNTKPNKIVISKVFKSKDGKSVFKCNKMEFDDGKYVLYSGNIIDDFITKYLDSTHGQLSSNGKSISYLFMTFVLPFLNVNPKININFPVLFQKYNYNYLPYEQYPHMGFKLKWIDDTREKLKKCISEFNNFIANVQKENYIFEINKEEGNIFHSRYINDPDYRFLLIKCVDLINYYSDDKKNSLNLFFQHLISGKKDNIPVAITNNLGYQIYPGANSFEFILEGIKPISVPPIRRRKIAAPGDSIPNAAVKLPSSLNTDTLTTPYELSNTPSPNHKKPSTSFMPTYSSSSASSTNFDLFSQDFKFDAPQTPKKQFQPTKGSASSGSTGGGSKGQAKVTGLENIGKEKDSKKPDFVKMIQDFFKAQAGGESAGAASGGESGGGSSGGSGTSSSENSSDNTKSVKKKGKQDFKNILQNMPFFNKVANSKQNDDKKQKTPNFANFIKSTPSQPRKSKDNEKSSNLPSFIGPPKLNFAQPQMSSAPSVCGAGGRVSDFGSSASKSPSSQANKPASPKSKQKPQMPPMPSLQPPTPPKSQKPIANAASPASSTVSSAPEGTGQKKGEDKELTQALGGKNTEKAKAQFALKIVDLPNNYANNKANPDKGEDFIGPRMPGTGMMGSALPQPMTVPDFERGSMTGRPSRRSGKMAPKIINRTIKEPDVKLTIRKPPKVDDAIEFARKLGNEQFIESMRMQ